MNHYLLAASAWGVRKGVYSRKRFDGMVNTFGNSLEECYKKVPEEKRTAFHRGYEVYKKGLEKFHEYSKKGDPMLLMKGLGLIAEGREAFLTPGASLCEYLNQRLLMTFKEVLERQMANHHI